MFRSTPYAIICAALFGSLLFTPSSAAAVDVAGVLLLGSGVATGDAENNPYQLQFGGAGEVTVSGFVLGVRGTRSISSDSDCDGAASCVTVKDLRAIGGDFGFDWEFLLLHISPRFGVGRLKEPDGTRVAAYIEPGGVAEVELGWITLGADLRYRVAINEPDANGVLAYFRGGLRF